MKIVQFLLDYIEYIIGINFMKARILKISSFFNFINRKRFGFFMVV
jgi:hypothetical protein